MTPRSSILSLRLWRMRARSFASYTSQRSRTTGSSSSNLMSIGSKMLSTYTNTRMCWFTIRYSTYRRRQCWVCANLSAITWMKRCIAFLNLHWWKRSGSCFSYCAQSHRYTQSIWCMETSNRAIYSLHHTINCLSLIRYHTSRHMFRRMTWRHTICTLESKITTRSAI